MVKSEAIGIYVEINHGLRVVIADDASEECAAEQRSADLGVGLIGVVNGPEFGLIFGDLAPAVNDVSGDEDVVGFFFCDLISNGSLAGSVGSAIAEDDKVRGGLSRFASDSRGFEDGLAFS